MIPILIDLFHVFVIVMMAVFVILCVVAASGEFDHWAGRFTKKQRIKKVGYVRRIMSR